MAKVITITGKVKFPITLDPSVWIFDERKIDLNSYFDEKMEMVNPIEAYTIDVSKHWDRELLEGAAPPGTEAPKKKFIKEILLTGTFGIPFKPFLHNAEPDETAKTVIIITSSGEHSMPLSKAEDLILGFSKNGKPLLNDGPVHIYFSDGSNKENPITHVEGFRIES